MTHILKTLLCVLLLLGIAAFILLQEKAAHAAPQKELPVDSIIIRSSQAPPCSARGVILITDKEEIQRLTGLFLNNPKVMHACGYDYDINFWAGNVLVDSSSYNMKCGEEFDRHTETIASLMKNYRQQLLAGESEALHCLKVPVEQDPQKLLENMRQDGLHVFPPYGLNARYPYLKLHFTSKGDSQVDSDVFEEEAQKTMLRLLSAKRQGTPHPIEHTPPSHVSSMFGGGQGRSVTLESIVRFPLGTNLEQAASAFEAVGLQVIKRYTPEVYLLELVLPKKDTADVAKLLKKYPGVSLR